MKEFVLITSGTVGENKRKEFEQTVKFVLNHVPTGCTRREHDVVVDPVVEERAQVAAHVERELERAERERRGDGEQDRGRRGARRELTHQGRIDPKRGRAIPLCVDSRPRSAPVACICRPQAN